jgi:alpha-galactosidase
MTVLTRTDLKYDNCGVPSNWTDQYNYCVPDPSSKTTNGTCPNLQNAAPAGYDWATSLTAERYRRMRDALLSVEADRTILYSLCDWGNADVNAWGNETGNSWRMSGDINRRLRLPPYPCQI